MDVHLMVTNPEFYVADFAAAGANRFTFHIEATQDAPSLISKIKQAGMLAGVALKPATPLSALDHIVHLVDLVLVMTVEPGFGGQAFMNAPLEKGVVFSLSIFSVYFSTNFCLLLSSTAARLLSCSEY